MKAVTLMAMAAVLLSSGCGGIRVDRLSLRDGRLPLEARSWLADAEDEVAISRARVEDARRELRELERYAELVEAAVSEAQFRKAGGDTVAEQLNEYLEARGELKELELDTALFQLDLSHMRLVQARAETAIRYDIAVYEMEKITAEVETLKNGVAAAQKKVEDKRVLVERSADKAWQTYGAFVQKGGVPNSLWSAREALK